MQNRNNNLVCCLEKKTELIFYYFRMDRLLPRIALLSEEIQDKSAVTIAL